MLIGTRNALQDKSNRALLRTNFRISEELIEQKTYIKYLGIQIDSWFKRKEQVASVINKLNFPKPHSKPSVLIKQLFHFPWYKYERKVKMHLRA